MNSDRKFPQGYGRYSGMTKLNQEMSPVIEAKGVWHPSVQDPSRTYEYWYHCGHGFVSNKSQVTAISHFLGESTLADAGFGQEDQLSNIHFSTFIGSNFMTNIYLGMLQKAL